jgi:hypothetical protein
VRVAHTVPRTLAGAALITSVRRSLDTGADVHPSKASRCILGLIHMEIFFLSLWLHNALKECKYELKIFKDQLTTKFIPFLVCSFIHGILKIKGANDACRFKSSSFHKIKKF